MAWGGIGSFAGLVFTVSSWRVVTPDNINGSTSSNWAAHSVIGGKEKSEYVGPGLKEYQFELLLKTHIERKAKPLDTDKVTLSLWSVEDFNIL